MIYTYNNRESKLSQEQLDSLHKIIQEHLDQLKATLVHGSIHSASSLIQINLQVLSGRPLNITRGFTHQNKYTLIKIKSL